MLLSLVGLFFAKRHLPNIKLQSVKDLQGLDLQAVGGLWYDTASYCTDNAEGCKKFYADTCAGPTKLATGFWKDHKDECLGQWSMDKLPNGVIGRTCYDNCKDSPTRESQDRLRIEGCANGGGDPTIEHCGGSGTYKGDSFIWIGSKLDFAIAGPQFPVSMMSSCETRKKDFYACIGNESALDAEFEARFPEEVWCPEKVPKPCDVKLNPSSTPEPKEGMTVKYSSSCKPADGTVSSMKYQQKYHAAKYGDSSEVVLKIRDFWGDRSLTYGVNEKKEFYCSYSKGYANSLSIAAAIAIAFAVALVMCIIVAVVLIVVFKKLS
jgi:hypothetical protein